MPFGAIPVIGPGAGAAAAVQDLQQRQIQQQNLMTQLLMHAQSMAAQREQTAAYREAQLGDKAERRRIAEEGRQEQQANAIPSGTRLSQSDVQSLGPAALGRFSSDQTLPSRQLAGWSPTQTGGTSSGETQAQLPGPRAQAPQLGTQAAQSTEVPSLPTGMFTKNPSEAELERKSRDAATAAQQDFNNKLNLRRIADTEGRAANAQDLGWSRLTDAQNKALQSAGQKGWKTEQATDPATGKPTWIRMNAETGEIKPMSPSDFAPKTNATTENRLSSAEAVLKTSADIKKVLSDPQNAAMLGPALSRYNNILDFIGNPPPQFAKLAGMIESYSLANMGVHGMRSANGAEAVKRTIGLGRHTPESLLAAIEGLNGFAENLMRDEGRGARIPTADTATPAGGGGRVRVRGPNGQTGTVPSGSQLPSGWTLVQGQ